MTRLGLPAVVAGLLSLVIGLSSPSPAKAQDINRYYHYNFQYYPWSYAPNNYYWPDPRQAFQPAPPYMAYPPYRDPNWRYDLYEYKRYHRGHAFFLDQF